MKSFNLLFSSIIVLVFVACEVNVFDAESDDSHNLHSHSASAVSDMVVTEGREFEERDGINVLAMPGSQINYNEIDSALSEVDLTYSDIIIVRGYSDVIENIDKLELLLEDNVNEEIRFSILNMLGGMHYRLHHLNNGNTHESLLTAKDLVHEAIEIFENNGNYNDFKADIADAKSLLVTILVNMERYDDAFNLLKYLIEEYQQIGYGPYENWFSSLQVSSLYNLALREDGQQSSEIVNYMNFVSNEFDNEVGISAEIMLVWHHFINNNQLMVEELSASIENRLTFLDNLAFKEDKWERMQTRMNNHTDHMSHISH